MKKPEHSPMADDLIEGVPALAKYLKWGRGKTYHAVYSGQIRHGRMGSSYVFSRAVVDADLAKLVAGTPT